MIPEPPRDKLEKVSNPFEEVSANGLTSKQWLRLRFYIAVALGDTAIIAMTVAVSSLIRFGTPFAPAGGTVLAMLLPLYLVMGLYKHNYSSHMLTNTEASAMRAVTSLLMAAAAVLFVAFCLQANTAISRELFGMIVVSAAGLLALSRLAIHRGTNRFLGGSLTCELLICDGVEVPALEGVTVIDIAELGFNPEVRDPFTLDLLGRLVQPADRVIIASPPERHGAWAMALKGANVRAELLAPEIDPLGTLGCDRYGGSTTLVVSAGSLDLQSRAIKRILDIGLAVAILILLAPLLALTALAVRLESAGPIFFVQPRLGRGNRLFNMYKFRSMRADMCDVEGRQSTTRNDSRITRVGRIIRATSIDELPQILNVLKGDMSFVGPRPHALGSLAEEKLFWEVDSRYWHRHGAKPGITGLAQVRGFRGATHQQSDLLNRLQSDLDYLNGWSIRRDIMILFATVKVVLHKNAY